MAASKQAEYLRDRGSDLHVDGFDRSIERLPENRLHFPIPLELTLPRIKGESREKYAKLLAFAKGDISAFDGKLASRKGWASRLSRHCDLVASYINGSAAVDHCLTQAYGLRQTRTTEDDLTSHYAPSMQTAATNWSKLAKTGMTEKAIEDNA